mmetsp:Transcript_28508/g.67253  ORF Transcript_28508/g.67253 Transcript_28508/m.67253 type:complete len:247 (-) Transcript_28508:192-932(-)
MAPLPTSPRAISRRCRLPRAWAAGPRLLHSSSSCCARPRVSATTTQQAGRRCTERCSLCSYPPSWASPTCRRRCYGLWRRTTCASRPKIRTFTTIWARWSSACPWGSSHGSRRWRAIPSSRAWAATCGATASYRALSLCYSLLTYSLTDSLDSLTYYLLLTVGTTASSHSRCSPTPPSPWPTSRAQRPTSRWSVVGGRCMVTSQRRKAAAALPRTFKRHETETYLHTAAVRTAAVADPGHGSLGEG